MSTHTDDLPVFLTRADVAKLLRLSPRQVDRLAASGTLQKQKLSASRSGFNREGVEAYLDNLAGNSGAAPIELALRARVKDGPAIDVPMPPSKYGTAARVLMVKTEVPGDCKEVGEALDRWLVTNGYRGCLLFASPALISVVWADNLSYSSDRIRRAIEKVKATVVEMV